MRYQNPILPGFNPDPSICRVGEDFYLVTSSFEYFPGVPIYHSRDLIYWRQIGHCLTRPSQLPLNGVESSGGIYAPTLRYHCGIFYMITTNVAGPGNFFVTAKDPRGPWSEPIPVAMSGIDPSLTFDGDNVYCCTNQLSPDGEPGISMAEIDPENGALLSDVRFIWAGIGGRAPESPHLYHIGDWYYLMIAEGGTQFTHMVTIARSKSPWGPYAACPRNPILTNIPTRRNEVHCTGHGDLVEDAQGNWWMVHLGIRISQKYMSHLGRETFLQPVVWDEDGWPVVNGGSCAEVEGDGPLPPQQEMEQRPEIDRFDRSKLSLCWRHLRNPYPEDYLLDGHGLTLMGNAFDVDATQSPAMLLQNQRQFDFTASTCLAFSPLSDGEQAGLILMTSGTHFLRAAKRRIRGTDLLVLEQRAGALYQEIARVELENRPVYLRVTGDRLRYRFSFGYDQEHLLLLGSGETKFLSCEVIGRSFTGVQIGLYAAGNGQRCGAPAVFSYFQKKEIRDGMEEA